MNESTTYAPALFSLDLAGLFSVHIRPHGVTLAVLPRWGLVLEVGITGKGFVAQGRVLGRAFYLECPSVTRGRRFLDCMVEERDRTFWLGRACLILERRG